MNCPSCARDNPPDAVFCSGCGEHLSVICASCGRSNPPDASFCNGCGVDLESSAAGARSPVRAVPAPVATEEALPSSFASGRYTVRRLLGEGAKKRVYLARDTRLDRDVAIGVIKREGLDAEGRLRVRREAQAMGRLGDHPHLVTVYDVIEDGDELLIVSQYMAGGDLERKLAGAESHQLSIEETLRVGDQICQALEHAHSMGIIHRDLKPGNVWLTRDGTAKLGDFGLALSLDRSRLTQEGMMVGTAAYMAPEQALGQTPDALSDLYGLGAMLYEMLTGRPPFGGEDTVTIISQHINTPPVAPSWHNANVSRPLEELVLGLLAKEPEQRPKTASAVRESLERITSLSSADAIDRRSAQENPLDGLSSGIFVGRESELERARACLGEALSSRGHVLMLVGEPGIGKTRMAEELSTYARLRGAQVLWGRGYEGEGAPVYWPWVQIIRAYVHREDPATVLGDLGSGASAVADVVSEVRERIPGIQPAPQLEPEQARFRLFDSISSFLKNASRRQPLVLVLDDLHWVDKPSLLLLQFLATEMGGSRILVLGTYRDVELRRTHPLAETLAELSRMDVTHRIVLRGLDEPDVGRFIELSAGRQPPPSLVQAVYRETEGNPFFVHEVVRLFSSEGRLEEPEKLQSWSLSVPQGIREVIGRRLNRLSEECNQVLAIGAVIGRKFDLAVLSRVSDLPADRVLELLEEAVAARVVEELPDTIDDYRFTHGLVRETLYEELSTTRRVRLHRCIGEVLEEHYAEKIDRHLAELAYHAIEGAHGGGDVEKGIEYATRAGERATALYAYEDAIPQYERALQALELSEAADDLKRCDLLIALGEAQYIAQDRGLSARTLKAALEISRTRSDPLRLARAATGISHASTILGEPVESSVALLKEALELLDGQDCPERIEVLRALVLNLFLGHTNPAAKEFADDAVEVARRLDDSAALVVALNARIAAYHSLASIEERFAAATEMLQLGETSGDPEQQVLALTMLRGCVWEWGDRAEFERLSRALEQILERTQNAEMAYYSQLTKASLAFLDADWAEGERLAHAALTLGKRIIGEAAVQFFGNQIVGLLLARGQLEVALSALKSDTENFAQPAYRCAVAWVSAECGRMDEARELFNELCADDFAAIPQDFNWAAAMAMLAMTCSYLGDRSQAESIYALLAPHPKRIITVGAMANLLGSSSLHLGRLAGLLGRPDDAAAHFEDALEVTAKMGSRFWMADTECAYASMLYQRGREGDRERAIELMNSALDAGRRYEMPYIVNKALALKLELQGIGSGEIAGSIHVVSSAVQERRPDLSSHTAPDGTVTLLFSDMQGFTEMTERLGDLEARELIRTHNSIVRDQLATHGGYEVELQGDGFLLAFGSAHQALLCAISIQRAFELRNRDAPEPIRVRIGLHTGEALKDADKFFGRTVILASRIAAQAQAGEILVSSLLKELTESIGDLRFGEARDVDLKGISDKQRLHTVEWD